jgi:DNA polymerase III sliding clamp (beta) subunit (PCNA family)
MLKAEFGVVSVLTRLVEGRPPSFKQLIPSDPPNKVQFYAPDFELALRRMTSAAKEGIGAVRMMWQGNSMKLSTDGGDAGQMELTIPAQPLDGTGRIAVNINYLLEYVKGKSGVVTMGVTTTSGPVLFNYSNFPIVVIMPMVVSWPDDLPTPAPTSEPPEDNLEGSEEPVDEQPDEETMPVD